MARVTVGLVPVWSQPFQQLEHRDANWSRRHHSPNWLVLSDHVTYGWLRGKDHVICWNGGGFDSDTLKRHWQRRTGVWWMLMEWRQATCEPTRWRMKPAAQNILFFSLCGKEVELHGHLLIKVHLLHIYRLWSGRSRELRLTLRVCFMTLSRFPSLLLTSRTRTYVLLSYFFRSNQEIRRSGGFTVNDDRYYKKMKWKGLVHLVVAGELMNESFFLWWRVWIDFQRENSTRACVCVD